MNVKESTTGLYGEDTKNDDFSALFYNTKSTEPAELYLGVEFQNVLQKFGRFPNTLNKTLIRDTTFW